MDRERARARRSDNQRRRVGSDGSKLGQADVGRASDPGGASVEEGAQKSEIMPKREERERKAAMPRRLAGPAGWPTDMTGDWRTTPDGRTEGEGGRT